ncbi:MAG: hypothetical protein M3R02_29470 [Chloroflexota bacterium]|nr:hypothetical protein [Chloroflexota bacterium]
MRRTPVLLSVVAVVLLGLVAAGIGPLARAQEGTPPPGGFEIAPGVVAEGLAFAAGQETPALYRLTFAPGVVYPIAPAPEISLVYSEAGMLTLTLDAPVTITRAGATGSPGEAVAAGTGFMMHTGDYAVFPSLVGGEARNDGPEAATVLVASIIPPGMATPVAGTPAS